MNQRGFVELEHVIADIPYKVLLPIGQTWTDAEVAVKAILDEITKFKQSLEDAAAKQAAEQAIPAESAPAEQAAPLEAEIVNN